MAINLETQYPGKINPSDVDYPYGSARNITLPGDGTGTPLEAAWLNDLFGFLQALLTAASVVPDGDPDTINDSQYLVSLRALFAELGQSYLTQQNGQTFQQFITSIETNVRYGRILSDVSITGPVTLSQSALLRGGRLNKDDKPTITSDTGQSGFLVTKTFSVGDPNIIAVTVADLKIFEQTQSKALGTIGLLYDRVNKGGRIEQVEIRGYEKGLNLRGVIGGVVEDVFITNNVYGLYTESENGAGLPGYDCTNTVFLHSVFNANDYGVYLGDLTQGCIFYGTNIERNNIAGLVMDCTPPASSVFGFYGAWFEGNPVAVRQIEKIKTTKFDTCYFFDNDELWENNASGFVLGEWNRCKIDSSHIDLDIFAGKFIDNDVTNCTFTATSPAAYQCEEWRGTAVSVSDGNTLLSTRNMGTGRYDVVAQGAPGTTNLLDGSKWHDVDTNKSYTKTSGVWALDRSEIIEDRTQDFGSIAAGGSLAFGPVTVVGAEVGDFVDVVVANGDMQGVVFQAYVSALNQVSGTLFNFTAGAIDLPNQTYRIRVQSA